MLTSQSPCCTAATSSMSDQCPDLEKKVRGLGTLHLSSSATAATPSSNLSTACFSSAGRQRFANLFLRTISSSQAASAFSISSAVDRPLPVSMARMRRAMSDHKSSIVSVYARRSGRFGEHIGHSASAGKCHMTPADPVLIPSVSKCRTLCVS